MTDTISALNTLASYLGPRDFDQINQGNLYTHKASAKQTSLPSLAAVF